jgi:polysaccharide biosynthesis protein PslH
MANASHRLRVLFVTPRLPYPPYRGDRLKIFNLMREASCLHEIFLLSFVDSEAERRSAEKLSPYCRDIRTVLRSPIRSVLSCAAALGGSDPFQVAYYRSETMMRELAKAAREIRPHVIHTHLIRMAQYRAAVPDVPNVLDLTDAVSLYLARFLEKERRIVMKMALRQELNRMRAYDAIIARFDRVLVCSPTDREFLARNVPGASVDVLPNGVDLEIFSPRPEIASDEKRVVFTGNMTYFPNTDGAKFLVHDIWPLVKARVPDATLYLVGQNPPPSVVGLAARDVVVTGFVPRIEEEYARSAIAVSPIRFGAGTLNKILEPLAMGIPVVCTEIGISGLGLENGRDVLMSDTAEGLANHIVRLLSDGALRLAMGRSGMERIRSRFSWGEVGKTLVGVYQHVAQREVD